MKLSRMLLVGGGLIVGVALLMSQRPGLSGPKRDPSKAFSVIVAEEGNVIFASPVVEGQPIPSWLQKKLDHVTATEPDGKRRSPHRPEVRSGILLVFDPPLPEGSEVDGPDGRYEIKTKPKKLEKWWEREEPGETRP